MKLLNKFKRILKRYRDNVRRALRRPFTLGRTLRWARVVVSIIMLLAITTLFVSTEARIARALGWLPKLHIIPLALSGAVTLLISWFAFTLIFGRIYCSWVCPMGVFQDIFIRLRRITRARRRRNPFRWASPRNKTRFTILILVAGSMVMGLSVFSTLLDPYSAYGRVAADLVRPAIDCLIGEPMVLASSLALAIAAITALAVAIAAFMRGRIVCNSVCPVGSTLGLISRFSLLHIDIDTDRCINCRRCERNCKAQCINLNDHTVDSSRCVACFNCVDVCDEDAIHYTTRRKKLALPLLQPIGKAPAGSAINTPESIKVHPEVKPAPSQPATSESSGPVRIDRRQFMATGLILAATPVMDAAKKGMKRIQALTFGGPAPTPTRYVAPPGRRNMGAFLEKCTGCGLCIARCPAKVLKPSSNQFGWLHALHPVMDYEHSYCRYNCTRCTQVCPTGALEPLTQEEKHIFIIGHAETDHTNCIGCGLCAERCPRKAITMVARQKGAPGKGWMVPRIDTDLCVGCGACEYICPAIPLKAIWVNGIV